MSSHHGRPKAKQEDSSETAVIDEFCGFLAERYGSLLKAWRRVLDPTSLSVLLFSEFFEALTRVSWHGDASALWSVLIRRASLNGADCAVGLREISPEDHKLFHSFQSWTVSTFGGPIEMFQYLNNMPNASLSFSEFETACLQHRFDGDYRTIFKEVLDLDNIGSISLRDIAYLESNALKRESITNPVFLMGLESAKAGAQQRCTRLMAQRQAQKAALQEFKKKVRATAGSSFIHGWRQILDGTGNLAVSKVELLKGCRRIGFQGDVVALWKALDTDDDGTVLLLDVDVPMAMTLAIFKKWAHSQYGCCVAALEQLAAMSRRRSHKWNFEDFNEALNIANFPAVPGLQRRQAVAMLYEACDLRSTGYIMSQDVVFLDKWEPTKWLSSSPDTADKDRFVALLRSRYSNIIVAWRKLLDHDDTNRVSYKGFCEACRAVKFHNIAGVWRALDVDLIGFISLRNVDKGAARILEDFKEWAENAFGTVQNAYRSLDVKHKNSLSLPALSRSLNNFGYKADAKALFQCLKADVSGRGAAGGRDPRLTSADVQFLTTWELPLAAAPVDREDASASPAAASSTAAPAGSHQSSPRRSRGGGQSASSPALLPGADDKSRPGSKPSGDQIQAAGGVQQKPMPRGSVFFASELHKEESPVSKKMRSTRSEALCYCRVPFEHKAMLDARERMPMPIMSITARTQLPRIPVRFGG
jgi:hypothetical protein